MAPWSGRVLVLVLCTWGCKAEPSSARGDSEAQGSLKYALDALPRALTTEDCPKAKLLEFAGETLRFSPPVRVIEPFRRRLLSFERVVRDVATLVYAREPTTILVAASYGCRSVSGKKRRLSEHAFGNAVDISGFRFAPVGETTARGARVPVALQGGFDVLVRKHWKARGDAVLRLHAEFLDRLTQELLARDTFRTLLGPSHPDHKDHFHFDMAPQHYVDL